jgi:hypothetical protein
MVHPKYFGSSMPFFQPGMAAAIEFRQGADFHR